MTRGAHVVLYSRDADADRAFISQMTAQGVACLDVQTERWGLLTHLTLPGGCALGVYEPTPP